jgi:hypothetical protein
MGSFGESLIFKKSEYVHHVFTLSDLINFHILLLAVPTFFLISCYLYARKNPAIDYCKKRIVRFATLAVFWTMAAAIWMDGYRGLLSLLPASSKAFITLILSAARTPYYFFVSLIILTVVTHIFSNLSTILNAVLFILSCLLIFALPEITMTYSVYALSAFWNPMNFFPYPFAAILLARKESFIVKRNTRLLIVAMLLAAAVLLGFYEWRFDINEIFFRGQVHAIPAYTRLSIVCLSILLFSIGLAKGIKRNRIIDFMSKQSLPVYCLHPFFTVLLKEVSFTKLPFSPFFIEMYKIIIVLLACYLTSLLFGKVALTKDSTMRNGFINN